MQVERLKGSYFFKNDEGYEQARTGRLFVGNVPERFPAAIVIAKCKEDVQVAVQYAKDSGQAITVRSGGHNWFGASLRDGCVLIDLGDMKSIAVDASTKTVTAEPGANGLELLGALEPHGLVYPVGHCPSVPLGGFLLGGGLGIGMERWGVGCDGIEGMTVVSPEGKLLECDAEQNSEYLWLARGGYTAMVGVVVSFKLRAHPLPACVKHYSMQFDLKETARIGQWLHALKQSHASSTKQVETTLVLSQCSPELQAASGRARVALVGLWALCDSDSEADQALHPFLSPPATPLVPPAAPARKSCADLVLSLEGVYPEKERYQCDSNWLTSHTPHIVWEVLDGCQHAFADAPDLGGPTSHHLFCIYSPWALHQPAGPFGRVFGMMSLVCLVYSERTQDDPKQKLTLALNAPVRAHTHQPGISEGSWTAGRRRPEEVYGARYEELVAKRSALDPAGRFGPVSPVTFPTVDS